LETTKRRFQTGTCYGQFGDSSGKGYNRLSSSPFQKHPVKAEHSEFPGIAKIKIQNDAKVQRHLVTDHQENMNLLFYDFNNFSKQSRPQTQGVA